MQRQASERNLQYSLTSGSKTPAGIICVESWSGTDRISASSARRGLQSENGRGSRKTHRRTATCDPSRRVWPTELADHASNYILCTAYPHLSLYVALQRCNRCHPFLTMQVATEAIMVPQSTSPSSNEGRNSHEIEQPDGPKRQKSRHRASVACATCRERRIRCVVPPGDNECSQCKRSGTECIIKVCVQSSPLTQRATDGRVIER